MTSSDLFNILTTKGNKFCYPFSNENENLDFLDFILGLIKDYLKLLKELDSDSLKTLNESSFSFLPKDKKPAIEFDLLRDAEAIANTVKSVLTKSFRSLHEEAYQELNSFFEKDNFFYLNMLPQLKSYNLVFYRIRKDFEGKNDGDIFHVPFEKRHLVGSQRFSIPGYPALYLGCSFLTAWHELELDKQDWNNISYAAFKFKEEETFLDLGFPLKTVDSWELYCLFAAYPLLVSCMVSVKYPDAKFKPEYIMPQLMMKIIRNHDKYFRGIAYMSNKVPSSYDLSSLESRNVVVCVNNTLCRSGYDKSLAERMFVSDIENMSISEFNTYKHYYKGVYMVDFNNILNKRYSFHDMDVPMETE